jgi:hypothetical protein
VEFINMPAAGFQQFPEQKDLFFQLLHVLPEEQKGIPGITAPEPFPEQGGQLIYEVAHLAISLQAWYFVAIAAVDPGSIYSRVEQNFPLGQEFTRRFPNAFFNQG